METLLQQINVVVVLRPPFLEVLIGRQWPVAIKYSAQTVDLRSFGENERKKRIER